MREVLEAIWANGRVSKPLHVAVWRENKDEEGGPALRAGKGRRLDCKPIPKVAWPDPPLAPRRSSRPRKRKG